MNNVVAFHGAEHKAGCTMMAQAAAEVIAGMAREKSIAFVALNARKSAEFLYEETPVIDQFKAQLTSGIGVGKGLLRPCKIASNLYILSGVEKEEHARNYFPETAYTLLESLSEEFDVVIADTGSELDNGLAMGALQKAGHRFFLLEQAESSIRRYERQREYYQRFSIGFDRYIINKFADTDPYTLSYIASWLSLERNELFKVSFSSFGRKAEMEHKSILELKDEKFKKDIVKIANHIMGIQDLGEIEPQRKRRWKNFI